MEEAELRESAVSGESSDDAESNEMSSIKRTRYDCFEQCMKDSWELHGQSVCSSVCGF